MGKTPLGRVTELIYRISFSPSSRCATGVTQRQTDRTAAQRTDGFFRPYPSPRPSSRQIIFFFAIAFNPPGPRFRSAKPASRSRGFSDLRGAITALRTLLEKKKRTTPKRPTCSYMSRAPSMRRIAATRTPEGPTKRHRHPPLASTELSRNHSPDHRGTAAQPAAKCVTSPTFFSHTTGQSREATSSRQGKSQEAHPSPKKKASPITPANEPDPEEKKKSQNEESIGGKGRG